jgi:hypothetical protein
VTPAQRAAERYARDSLNRLLLAWSGALLSADVSSSTRDRARAATAAARKALAAGVSPAEVVREHVAAAFEVGA